MVLNVERSEKKNIHRNVRIVHPYHRDIIHFTILGHVTYFYVQIFNVIYVKKTIKKSSPIIHYIKSMY